MKSVSETTPSLFQENKSQGKTKPRNPRDEILDFFFDKLAPSYFQYEKRKLTKAHLASKLYRSCPTLTDLAAFKSMCLDAERRNYPFSKYFWGNLKVRPENWTS